MELTTILERKPESEIDSQYFQSFGFRKTADESGEVNPLSE